MMRDILLAILLQWPCQFRLSSRTKPRKSKLDTRSIAVLLILISGISLGRSFRWRRWKIINFDFFTFNKSLLAINQLLILLSSAFMSWDKVSAVKEQSGLVSDVSSAKRMNLNNVEQLLISFIYIRNKSGPKTDPCGTPFCICRYDE